MSRLPTDSLAFVLPKPPVSTLLLLPAKVLLTACLRVLIPLLVLPFRIWFYGTLRSLRAGDFFSGKLSPLPLADAEVGMLLLVAIYRL